MRGVADFGGDPRVRATFTNGDTQNIRGNEGFTAAASFSS
jgi:hypothetical protein